MWMRLSPTICPQGCPPGAGGAFLVEACIRLAAALGNDHMRGGRRGTTGRQTVRRPLSQTTSILLQRNWSHHERLFSRCVNQFGCMLSRGSGTKPSPRQPHDLSGRANSQHMMEGSDATPQEWTLDDRAVKDLEVRSRIPTSGLAPSESCLSHCSLGLDGHYSASLYPADVPMLI